MELVKKKLTVWLLTMSMMLSLLTPALAVETPDAGESADITAADTAATNDPAETPAETSGEEPEEAPAEAPTTDPSANALFMTYGDLAAYSDDMAQTPNGEDDALPFDGEADDVLTQSEAVSFLLLYSGLKKSQLGVYPRDYEAMADSLGLTYEADAPCTKEFFESLLNSETFTALYDALHADKMAPLFLNGMAQPIFPYTTGAVTEGYDNADSDIIRYCVYVETNYDTDGDGKLDLVKALVQLPRAAAEGDYQAATIYEARPYITGCNSSMNPGKNLGDQGYDIASMYSQPAQRTAAGTATTMEAAAEADSADWYYYNPYERMYDYEDLDWYDYYLVRGFAVVECGGLGTKGSDGFETCGTDLEIDAFKCVIEWLHGDRVAYTDK